MSGSKPRPNSPSSSARGSSASDETGLTHKISDSPTKGERTSERLNEEIRRRTYVVRIFPNAESCLRLVRTLAVETHKNWMETNRYINMDDLKEHKKRALRQAA